MRWIAPLPDGRTSRKARRNERATIGRRSRSVKAWRGLMLRRATRGEPEELVFPSWPRPTATQANTSLCLSRCHSVVEVVMLETQGSERGDASSWFSAGARVGTRIAGCTVAPDRDPALNLTLTLHPDPSKRQRYFPPGTAANRPLSRSGGYLIKMMRAPV